MSRLASEELPRLFRDVRAITDDFETWAARLALTVALDDVLSDDAVHRKVVDAGLTPHQVAHAVLRDEAALAKVGLHQARAQPSASKAPVTARDVGWFLLSAIPTVASLSVLRLAWDAMPVPYHVLGILGTLGALGLSLSILLRKAPRTVGIPPWYPRQAERPHERLLALGDRREEVHAEIVRPAVGTVTQRRSPPVYGTRLRFRRVTGLYGDDDAAVISTRHTDRLRRVVNRAESGAIALAGSRGTGKTTAIRSLATDPSPRSDKPSPLVVRAEAPNRYDGRDFLLHLHARFCAEVDSVLGRAFEDAGHSMRPTTAVGAAVRTGARFAVVTALLLGVSASLWGTSAPEFAERLGDLLTEALRDPPGSVAALWTGQPARRVIAVGLAGLAALRAAAFLVSVAGGAMRLAVWFARRRRLRPLTRLRNRTREARTRIRFLQTSTAGWSGKVATPFKSELTRSRTIQHAEQPLTHPDVVDQFRRFAEECGTVLREEGIVSRIIVAIDELDKIEDPAQAQDFVNDVKGVFDVAGCLFVVSVSDDAIASFEQRGLTAIRDAFDSAFSEMIRLEPFELDESATWLTHRLVDLPRQFCALCHCLSGGLPRELHRYTVEMADIAATVHAPSLSTVTEILVGQQLAARARAFTGMVTTMEQSPELLELASELSLISESSHASEMLDLAHRLVERTERLDFGPVHTLRWHSGCFLLFCATMLDVFDDDLTHERLTDDIPVLAAAQRRMAAHPQLAWRLLLEVRKRFGLDTPTAT
ncbi:hypothetical protein [Saccharomonospora saliphila]|uniref:hypothetical protein n=1 Tax=Saccharomonospora saliphila TaxID=369829 RepID=UPI0003755F45|nr:hypothetical protein [Saccharomonospora saliphila]